MGRVYFVIDMKSFFASVELTERGLDPYTSNLVVADIERTEKTICLAVSINMKKLGVKNRCRLWMVPKNIDYIIAKPRMSKYIEYASNIYGLYLNYIDKNDIHVYSIDECFIDVTDYLKLYNMRAKAFATLLMNEIWNKFHIPSTCGIGSNLYLAKIALDITAKSSKDRIGWLNEEKFINTLSDYEPITDFWRISEGTKNRLLKYGIKTQRGIRECNPDILYKEFGIDAEILIDHSKGCEPVRMEDIKNYKSKSKSISSHEILKENYNKENAKIILKELVQNICYRLYENKKVTDSITIMIGYANGGWTHFTQSYNFRTAIYNFLINDIIEKYDNKVMDIDIKRLGASFIIYDMENEYYNLFFDETKIEKEKKLIESIINLKNKYGKNSVLKALDYDSHSTVRERNELIGGHKK